MAVSVHAPLSPGLVRGRCVGNSHGMNEQMNGQHKTPGKHRVQSVGDGSLHFSSSLFFRIIFLSCLRGLVEPAQTFRDGLSYQQGE